MKVNIVQIGNSQGVRIPKSILEQLKFDKSVEFEVLPEGLLLRPSATKQPREGWAEQFAAALAESADDAQDFSDWNLKNEFDEEEW